MIERQIFSHLAGWNLEDLEGPQETLFSLTLSGIEIEVRKLQATSQLADTERITQAFGICKPDGTQLGVIDGSVAANDPESFYLFHVSNSHRSRMGDATENSSLYIPRVVSKVIEELLIRGHVKKFYSPKLSSGWILPAGREMFTKQLISSDAVAVTVEDDRYVVEKAD